MNLRIVQAVHGVGSQLMLQSAGSYPERNVTTTPKMFSDLSCDVEHAIRWLALQRGIDAKR